MKVKPLNTSMHLSMHFMIALSQSWSCVLKLTLNLSMSAFRTCQNMYAHLMRFKDSYCLRLAADFTSKEGRWVLSLNEEFGKTAKGQREGSYSFWGSNMVKLCLATLHRSAATLAKALTLHRVACRLGNMSLGVWWCHLDRRTDATTGKVVEVSRF